MYQHEITNYIEANVKDQISYQRREWESRKEKEGMMKNEREINIHERERGNEKKQTVWEWTNEK